MVHISGFRSEGLYVGIPLILAISGAFPVLRVLKNSPFVPQNSIQGDKCSGLFQVIKTVLFRQS
jgi:hypothetical protein